MEKQGGLHNRREPRNFEELVGVVIDCQLLWKIDLRCLKLCKLRLVHLFQLAVSCQKVEERADKRHDVDLADNTH